MNRQQQKIISVIALTSLLVGCGGGDDGPSGETAPCNAVTALVTLGLACIVPVTIVDSTPDTPPPPPPAEPPPEPTEPPPTGFTPENSPLITFEAFDVEPNNEIATASPTSFPTPLTPTQSVGFHVRGNYSNLTDGMDTYAMVANRARTFVFHLCASSAAANCNQISPDGKLDIEIAHLNIYDQTGLLLATSQMNTIDGNLLTMPVDAGVLYYVMVVAENTGNSEQTYFMRVHESTTET